MLRRLLIHAENNNGFHSIKIVRNTHAISYILYADDLILFCITNLIEINIIHHNLQKYFKWSGQREKLSKLLYFSHEKDAKFNIL